MIIQLSESAFELDKTENIRKRLFRKIKYFAAITNWLAPGLDGCFCDVTSHPRVGCCLPCVIPRYLSPTDARADLQRCVPLGPLHASQR